MTIVIGAVGRILESACGAKTSKSGDFGPAPKGVHLPL